MQVFAYYDTFTLDSAVDLISLLWQCCTYTLVVAVLEK